MPATGPVRVALVRRGRADRGLLELPLGGVRGRRAAPRRRSRVCREGARRRLRARLARADLRTRAAARCGRPATRCSARRSCRSRPAWASGRSPGSRRRCSHCCSRRACGGSPRSAHRHGGRPRCSCSPRSRASRVRCSWARRSRRARRCAARDGLSARAVAREHAWAVALAAGYSGYFVVAVAPLRPPVPEPDLLQADRRGGRRVRITHARCFSHTPARWSWSRPRRPGSRGAAAGSRWPRSPPRSRPSRPRASSCSKT